MDIEKKGIVSHYCIDSLINARILGDNSILFYNLGISKSYLMWTKMDDNLITTVLALSIIVSNSIKYLL